MKAGGLALLLGLLLPLVGSAAGQRVLLIGADGSEGPGRHEHARGLVLLEAFLREQPEAATWRIDRHPHGWPDAADAFDDVATIVLYSDGLDRHPLREPARRRHFEQLIQQGVGVVMLHQASTAEAGPLAEVLRSAVGAVRIGRFDRTTETVMLQPQSIDHPVNRGVGAFAYRDEFYPSLQFDAAAQPLLSADLRVQHRAGVDVVDDRPQRHTVAWAWQRPEGGRGVGYSGTHFLAAFDQPMLRRLLVNAVLWTARVDVPAGGAKVVVDDRAEQLAKAALAATAPRAARADSGVDVPGFHGGATRSGWHAQQPALGPREVAAADFGLLWESPAFDAGAGEPARLYASPLYLDRVRIDAGPQAGEIHSVVFAASNQGEVQAINAAKAGDVAPGRVLWRTRLADPCHLKPAPLDGVATGVLSTPVIDVARGRLYLTTCDATLGWQAYALAIGTGQIVPGWPLRLDEAALNAVNRNAGPRLLAATRRHDFRVQRGALNLSPDGRRLYIGFGETETGWLASVDTDNARLASAFAVAAMPHRGSGGIWGAGGAAVDADGTVFVVSGSGFNGYKEQPADWTQSLLALREGPGGLELHGTYTPFNHCATATADIDLGSGGVALLPVRAGQPQLLALGGKQGNAYLLDRTRLPGRLDQRPGCSSDAASDASLLPPGKQPQFGTRGPLNVFGPYSEQDAALNRARARSTPAAFIDAAGTTHVFMTGNNKDAAGSERSVPPSLVRLEVSRRGRAPYLRVAASQPDIVFGNPGAPQVTSDGGKNAVVWVLDENAPRSALLVGADAPRPLLYAFDAISLKLLWRSEAGLLNSSGKYNEPGFANGVVLVGTDRIQAFGSGAVARAATPAPTAVASAPPTVTAVATMPATPPTPDGAALYRRRCAACHDHPTGNIPPRDLLARYGRQRIIDALTVGAMRAQAAGLNKEAIAAIAEELQ